VSGLKSAAQAIRRTSHDVANRKQRTMVAVVRQVAPLRVELTESRIFLDEDDLSLGQWVRRYEKDKGLKVGDSLVVTPLHSGDWVASEVLSSQEPPINVDANDKKPKITGSRDSNAALKDLLKALNDLGIVKDETTA
jgi:hypothetical protein